MSAKSIKFIHSLIALILLLVSSFSSVQAYLPEVYRENRDQQTLENDPQYYISLRWLVYMLILSLPIAPSQTHAPQAPPLIPWTPPVVREKNRP